MATPKAIEKRDSSDTPDTSFASIFDSDDSPLSSPASSVVVKDDSSVSEYEDRRQRQSKLRNGISNHPEWDIVANRGTAASQRTRRVSKKLLLYTNSFNTVKRQTREQSESHAETEQTSVTAQDTTRTTPSTAERDERPARLPKRKQQATAIDVTPEPQQEKLRTTRAGKTLRSKLNAEPAFAQGLQSPTPAPPCQLRKRKLDTVTTRVQPPPPSKKARTTPSNARTKPKSKSSPKTKWGPRAPAKSEKQTRSDAAAIEALPQAGLEGDSLVVRLKMPTNSPSWFSRGGTPVADSQRTTFSTQAYSSFESSSNQPTADNGEQCAQAVLTPLLASSQFTSTDSFPRAHPLPESQKTISEEYDAYTSQAELLTISCPLNEQPGLADVLSQPQISEGAKGKKSRELQTTSSYQTQPTQPWSQPLEFLRSKNYALPETGDAASDWGSDATTEQEEPCVAPESTRLSQEQSHLLKIAEQLFANRKPGMKKPAPSGQPEVWAEGRQELCETLHYYRAYQSGCYSTGGFARGFMFDKVAHERDYIDNDVVISRAGGGLVKDNESGRDQADQGPVVTALKNCMTHCNPVVILAGADNPHIPSQPPHQYCVLDYFKPTHIWVEKSGNGKIVRYRFEKLNTHKKSWWSPENEEDQVELGSLDPPVERICNCCGELSMQIYLNGWMCLQPSCTTFWHIMEDMNFSSHGKSKEPVEVELIYDPRFLKQKTPWPNDNFEYSLKYDGPQVSEHAVPGEDTSQSFSSGIVCPDCGRCNSRLAWAGWECSTPNCNFKMLPRHSLVPARSLHERFWPLSDSYTMSRDTHVPLLELTISFAHGYRINRYQIPGLDGFITHMIANKTVVEENGGPNAMFEELQETDIDLRRRVMPNGQLKGDSHCCHFSVNYGMPYKFIAATASHSFDGAARPINATRSRLNWAAKYLAAQDTARLRLAQQTNRSLEEGQRLKNYHEVLASQTKMVMEEGNDAEEFNEVLALGYFESQKMNYHDDGEFGLGPTVATLSLGAPGTMRIRMKDRHYHGASAAGVYDDARPIPGCSQYEARLALQSELDTLKASDPKAYGARRKQIPKELKLKHSGHAKDVLKMELGHGDIVVMHGTELQKYYEHAVDHAGKLRFALTCRYIDPKSLKEADQPDYEVGPDLGGYDGAKLC